MDAEDRRQGLAHARQVLYLWPTCRWVKLCAYSTQLPGIPGSTDLTDECQQYPLLTVTSRTFSNWGRQAWVVYNQHGICTANYLASLPINKGCLQGFQYGILVTGSLSWLCVRDRGSLCTPGCIYTHYVTNDGLYPWYSGITMNHHYHILLSYAIISCFFLLLLKVIFIFPVHLVKEAACLRSRENLQELFLSFLPPSGSLGSKVPLNAKPPC